MSIFSNTIKVPISTLQDAAEKILTYSSDNEDVFDRLINIMTAMESSQEWQGESMTTALATMRSNQSKFEEAIDDLTKLSNYLATFITKMNETDVSIATQINSI